MRPETTTVSIKPIEVNIGPRGFHRYAMLYLRAARLVQGDQKSEPFSPVPYYLYCRALELVLKAFLLGQAVPMRVLKKKLGHDLERILKKADELSLRTYVDVTENQQNALAAANDYYKDKGFEYFQVVQAMKGYSGLPELGILDELASQLVSNLESFCRNASGLHTGVT